MTEYKQWKIAARAAMAAKYSSDEVDEIIQWFDCIKGAGERDLTGHENQGHIEALRDMQINARDGDFDLYSDMMMRLWIYAPLIAKEYRDAKLVSSPTTVRPAGELADADKGMIGAIEVAARGAIPLC